MAITANKICGVRADVIHDSYSAERARASNDAQIATFGSLVISVNAAKKNLDIWLESEFGVQGLRDILGVYDRPLMFGVIKPNVGLSPEPFAKMTDTLNLNIWDFWEAIIATLIVYGLTDNIVAGLIFGSFLAWFNLMMSDFNAQRGYCADIGFEGLSFYQGTNVAWGAFGHYVGKLLDKTGMKADITPDYIQEKFGVIGEPSVLGGIIGILMGIGAGYYWIDCVMLAIALATSLVLIPMMSGIVMQALVPVTEAAAKFMKTKAGGRQLYIGVDHAIAVGNTTVLATTVLMVPILLLLAFVIPGTPNHPLADLPSLLFFWVFVVAPNKFDMLRTLITTTLMGIYGTFAAIWGVAKWSSMVAVAAGVDVAEGTGVTAWFNHLCPEMLVAGLLGESYDTIGMTGLIGFCVVVILITIVFRLRYLKSVKAAAA